MMEKVYKVVIIDDEECAIDNLCFELKNMILFLLRELHVMVFQE